MIRAELLESYFGLLALKMKLLIVIPALNEEDSIESIIERSLAARSHIFANSPVTEVAITVVSDGSTDRTVERAGQYRSSIRLLVFKQNRGYGAAIQTAWQESDADLLAFLDADGTCDPKFFANLCQALHEEQADLALGCRLNQSTKMPLIRQVGNLFFAALLTAFSNRRVRDTASGMRVIKREVYQRLRPLPNGLHFTPAMSARALLGAGGGTKLIEIDMPYHEREGVSKLHVVKDGLRFLRIITETAFLYKPGRMLSQLAAVLLIVAVLIGLTMTGHSSPQRWSEWSFFPLIFGGAAFLFALLLFSAASAMQQMADLTIGGETGSTPFSDWVHQTYTSRFFWIAPFLLALSGVAAMSGGLPVNGGSGASYPHLIREWAASFLWLTAIVLVIGRVLAYFVDLLRKQMRYARHADAAAEERAPDLAGVMAAPK